MRGALPKIEALPGSVHVQRVRCGKANCRCARGRPHAAHYRFWREGGRLRKVYVSRADLGRVRAGCERWRRGAATVRAILSSPEADEQRRQIRAMLRDAGVSDSANCLRSRSKDKPGPDVAELAAAVVSFRLPSFRF